MEHRDITRSALLRIGRYDLPTTIAATIFWSWVFDASDVRVLLVLMVLRVAAWVAHANRLLEPVRAWPSGEISDQQLVAIDTALDRFLPRFLPAYIAGWMVALGLAILLGKLGVPVAVESGSAERLLATLLLPVVAVRMRAIKPVITGALLEIQTHTASLLIARRLSSKKPARSLTSEMTSSFVTLSLAVTTLLCAIAGMVRVNDLREQAAIEQARRAEVVALRVRHGELFALEPGLSIVETDELPPALASDLGDETRRAIEPAQDQVLAAAPVGDGRWVLARAAPDEQLGFLLAFWLVFTTVLSIPIVMSSRALARSLVDPITTLDDSTRKIIDEGKVRSLSRIVTLQDDEIGRLAANFNRLLDQLATLAAAASAVADGNLKVQLEHPGELHDAFRGMLARLREVVGQIRATALELASTAAEIHASTREQQISAELQAANMLEVSTTVDSLAATATEITRSAALVLSNANNAAATTQQTTKGIAEFDQHARGIAQLLEQIHEIADRSDLLALNGSLEAVRAGEAGRGFALVAGEMRRLAERVNNTVASVRERVSAIQLATEFTVESTQHNQALVESTAEAARAIAEITFSQGRVTQHASEAVRQAAAGVTASAVAITQTRASAEALRQQSAELEKLVRRFAD